MEDGYRSKHRNTQTELKCRQVTCVILDSVHLKLSCEMYLVVKNNDFESVINLLDFHPVTSTDV
jgi:hypothetical protein